MANLATATVFINTNLGALSKGLKDAERATKATVGNITNSLNKIGKGMSIAGGVVTGAVGLMVKSSVDLGSQIADLQGKTGLSTEAISELGFALKLSGGEIATLDPAMKGLAKSLDKAKEEAKKAAADGFSALSKESDKAARAMEDIKGKLAIAEVKLREMTMSGKASQSAMMSQRKTIADLKRDYDDAAFSFTAAGAALDENGEAVMTASGAYMRLGLDLNALDKMNPDEKLMSIASAVAGVVDPTERAALAMAVFGKGGADMLPILANGAAGLEAMRQKARDLGFSFDQDLIDKADEFGDTIDIVKMGLQAGLMRVVEQMLPLLQEFGTWLQDATKSAVEWIKNNPEQVKAFGELALKIGAILTVGGPMVLLLSQVLGGFVLLKNAVIAIAGISTLGPWIAGIIGTAGGGLMGFGIVLGTIVGAAGLGWAFGRWIDNLTANTAFGKWIDKISDGLVGIIDNLKTVLGMQDEARQKNDAIKVGVGVKAETLKLAEQRVGKNANGTNFWPGGPTWVGERGPEILIPPRGSQIIPNGESMRMAGGTTINGMTVNLVADGTMTPRRLLDLWKEAMKLNDARAGA